MQILLYEFITGGGWHLIDPHAPPAGSLLAEGAAMRDALASDLIAGGFRLSLLNDQRLSVPLDMRHDRLEIINVESALDLEHRLKRAAECDAAILIAPEFGSHLLNTVCAMEHLGVRLLSPSAEFVEITSDKHRTAEMLREAGVPTPVGAIVDDLAKVDSAARKIGFPAIVKPNDGAGSLDVRRIEHDAVFSTDFESSGPWRVEQLVEGRAASVAVLCGKRNVVCPPFSQRLSSDGKFSYQGGQRIEEGSLAARARRLATRGIDALPGTIGYVGIDLILGPADDGTQDCIIEVNPRLTTSYLGLRQLVRGNLAEAMIHTALGQPTDLSWDDSAIEFEV